MEHKELVNRLIDLQTIIMNAFFMEGEEAIKRRVEDALRTTNGLIVDVKNVTITK